MVLAILFLLVAILCAIAIVREMKRKNFLAVVFASVSFLVFGFFSIATIISIIFIGDGAPQ